MLWYGTINAQVVSAGDLIGFQKLSLVIIVTFLEVVNNSTPMVFSARDDAANLIH